MMKKPCFLSVKLGAGGMGLIAIALEGATALVGAIAGADGE